MKDTLLLVDDEEDIREVLSLSLTDLGYDVCTAENGARALEVFRERKPAIVLTDIKMPGIDGIELLRRIKHRDPEVEVVMITGHGDLDLAIRSLREEAADFITKPIDVDALEKALRRVQEKILVREKLTEYTRNLEGLLLEKSARRVPGALPGARPAAHPQASQDNFHEIFDRLPCYITMQDRTLAFSAVNKRFQKDFGRAVGRPCFSVCKQLAEPCPDCMVRRTFADGRSHQREEAWVDRDGQQYNLLAWTAPVHDRRGAISHVLTMSTDINRVLDLQDHLASLGMMVGSISHGIKGLLTGLDGGMYLLDSGIAREDQKKIREGRDTVKLVVDRIRDMVLDILFYAKERDLSLETIPAGKLAREVADIVAPRFLQQGIDFEYRPNPGLETVRVDAGQMSAALINILENALDACLEAESDGRRVIFGVHPRGDRVRFTVTDDGVGMDAETRKNMFNLFFSAKGKKGTGLGLFITNKIVTRHGGDITVDSAPGQGTEMTVTIPAAPAEPPP